jgi:hypothetical protein
LSLLIRARNSGSNTGWINATGYHNNLKLRAGNLLGRAPAISSPTRASALTATNTFAVSNAIQLQSLNHQTIHNQHFV